MGDRGCKTCRVVGGESSGGGGGGELSSDTDGLKSYTMLGNFCARNCWRPALESCGQELEMGSSGGGGGKPLASRLSGGGGGRYEGSCGASSIGGGGGREEGLEGPNFSAAIAEPGVGIAGGGGGGGDGGSGGEVLYAAGRVL